MSQPPQIEVITSNNGAIDDFSRSKLAANPLNDENSMIVTDDSALKVPARTPSIKPIPLLKTPMGTRAPFIIVNELCEKMACFGISTNLIMFMTKVFHLSNSRAAIQVGIFNGTCYLTPILGAFLADAYLGRFKVIVMFSCLFYIPGLILLCLSAGLPSLHPASGEKATSGQLAVLYTSLYLIAVGSGGIKPCVSPFGADQFDSTNPAEASLIPHFFNYYFAAVNTGAIIASLFLVYVQEMVSWTWGYGIPALLFVVSVGIFLIGVPRYRFVPPSGSPFFRFFRVLRGAFAHRKAVVPEDEKELYEYEGEGKESIVVGQEKLPRTASFKWLEKACTVVEGETMPEDEEEYLEDIEEEESEEEEPTTTKAFAPAAAPAPANKKNKRSVLVTLTEVEELKMLIRLLPIALTLVMYNAMYAQMSTMFIIQGSGMDTYIGSLKVPPATVSVLDSLSVVIFVFVWDLGIVPYFKKKGRPVRPLQRFGWGYCVVIGSMLLAGILEVVRLNVVHDNGLTNTNPAAAGAPIVPISVWWQIPQYSLMGLSEVFTMVGSYFYQESPDGLRSTCSAMQLLATALGHYLSSALIAIIQAITDPSGNGGGWIASNVNEARLDYWFFTLAVLMAINTVFFFYFAKRYRYRDHAVHMSFDPEALALTPEGRHGVPFSAGMVKAMSQDIHDGLVTMQSLRSSNVVSMKGRSYKRSNSQYRTISKRRSSHAARAGAGAGMGGFSF